MGDNLDIMRKNTPHERLWLFVVSLALLGGCQQADQSLPFELEDGDGVARTIGSSGGTLSLPPSFSIHFPSGALASSVEVTVARRTAEPFPGDRGEPVPGTAFDVAPLGTVLSVPARVQLAVDPALLEGADDVRLVIGVLRGDGSVATFLASFDPTNGILTSDVDELGPMSAVIVDDAVAVSASAPPTLQGGTMAPPAAPAPVGPSATSHGGVRFTGSCAPEARRCFSSGVIRLWADDAVVERLGSTIFLLAPRVEASLDFLQFDTDGLPTEVVGSISIAGELRARLSSTVSRYDVDDGVTTGPSTDPVATPLDISGNLMVLSQTTESDGTVEFNEELDFEVTGIGTSEMLIIEVEAEIDFENEDGSFTTGLLTAHVRLRR